MNKLNNCLALSVLGLVVLATGCKKDDDEDPAPTPTPTPSLYSQVGGTTMVADPAHPGQMIEQGYLSFRSVVDSTIFVIAADPQLQPFFAVLLGEVTGGNTTNLAILSENLTEFFSVAAGGTNFTYSGLNMVDAHNSTGNPRMSGLANNAAFDRFIADVVTGAQQNSVPDNIITQVGALIETLRDDVVQQ